MKNHLIALMKKECEKQLTRAEKCVFIAEIKEGRDD